MAIAVDNTSNGTGANSSELTVAHTVTSVAGGGILVVTIQVTDSSDTDRVISTVTHNGEACTHLPGADADDTVEERSEIWYRANPTTGGTPNIVVTPGGPCTDLTLGAISLTGVNSLISDGYRESNRDRDSSLSHIIKEVAQSFNGVSGSLSSARFYLLKNNSPTGNAVAKLYSHSGVYGTSSVPDSLLATSDNFDVSTLTTSHQLIKFSFPTPYSLSSGVNYCIALEYTNGDATDYIKAGRDGSSSTHSGNYSSFGWGAWDALSSEDLIFYILTVPTQSATGDSTPPTLSITTAGTSSYVIDSLAIAESDGTKIGVVHDSIHKTDVGGDTHASQYVDAGGAGAQTMNYTDTDQDKKWALSAVAIQAAVDTARRIFISHG